MESSVSYFEKALNLARLHQDSAIINAIQKVSSLMSFLVLVPHYLKDIFHHLSFWF